jgi:hypothetical protein
VSDLRPLVVQADRMSMRRLLSAPMCPQERSMCDSKRFGAVHPCSIFRSHWMSILDRLHVDASQADALLSARKAALEQLRVIYEVRGTCMQLMHVCVMSEHRAAHLLFAHAGRRTEAFRSGSATH